MDPKENLRSPEKINPVIASSTEEAKRMKEEGVDTIIFRPDQYEVIVFTKNPDVVENIIEGSNWNSGENTPDEKGYYEYVYTRLNESQLVEHLKDPSKFRGEN
ncbi:MAG: hypothetical protein WC705_03020 [Candidatus Paceibacterota bacterium]|jgi:hypothetical protein